MWLARPPDVLLAGRRVARSCGGRRRRPRHGPARMVGLTRRCSTMRSATGPKVPGVNSGGFPGAQMPYSHGSAARMLKLLLWTPAFAFATYGGRRKASGFFQPLGPVPARRQERDGLLARIPAGDQRSHRRIVRCVGSLGGTLTGGPMGGLLVRAVRASSAGRPIWTAVITRAAVAMPTCRLVTGRESGGRTGRRFGWVQS